MNLGRKIGLFLIVYGFCGFFFDKAPVGDLLPPGSWLWVLFSPLALIPILIVNMGIILPLESSNFLVLLTGSILPLLGVIVGSLLLIFTGDKKQILNQKKP